MIIRQSQLIVFLYVQKLMTLKDGMVLRTLTGGFL
nr:MAG TPA: hypothetical protein [Caudoviricetes sp.]